MLIITPESHLDHHLTMGHLRFILAAFGRSDGFFAETVCMPPESPALPCSLRGPVVGLAPVTDAEVLLQIRPGRVYPSRILRMNSGPKAPISYEPLLSRLLTVIAGPDGDLPCVLYTAYGGPLAPKEPGDPSLSNDERAASEAFWAVHALAP